MVGKFIYGCSADIIKSSSTGGKTRALLETGDVCSFNPDEIGKHQMMVVKIPGVDAWHDFEVRVPKNKVIAGDAQTIDDISFLNDMDKSLQEKKRVLIIRVDEEKSFHFSHHEFNGINQTVLFDGERFNNLYEFEVKNGKHLTRCVFKDWIRAMAVEQGLPVLDVSIYHSRERNLLAKLSFPGTDRKPMRKSIETLSGQEKLVGTVDKFLDCGEI